MFYLNPEKSLAITYEAFYRALHGSWNGVPATWRDDSVLQAFFHLAQHLPHERIEDLSDLQEMALPSLKTAGSTGQPKAVTHKLKTLLKGIRLGDAYRDAVWGFCYHPAHIAGVQVFLQAYLNQNTLINLYPLAPHQVAETFFATPPMTHLSATPTFYRMLLPLQEPVETVQRVTLGGEPVDAALVERLRNAFPNARIRNIYATTEAGTLLTSHDDTFAIPPEMQALIQVFDHQIFLHQTLLPFPVSGEWYPTGDMVTFLDDRQRFRIVHRIHETINVGGEKVNPRLIESVLESCRGIREAWVYGKENAVTGELVCAQVVTTRDFDETGLRQELSRQLAPHQVPRIITKVDVLPRNRAGKRQRI